MRNFLAALFCFLALSENVSAQGIERKAFELTVLVDSSAAYTDSVKGGPFVNGPNILQIYPGEKLYLEVEQIKDSVVRLISVSANKRPERTLVVSLTQHANGRVHESMFLQIKNPFKKNLFYQAQAFFLKPNKWARTSVLPVMAGKESYETWSDIIITMALYNWKFLDDAAGK